ncbi:hypothetical protein BDQ17DRAFT_1334899 [Cyathus striatus]|nr:hypothetical protein BDQ17DRAFT_1334899 [Cyathus striatus]
MYTKALPSTLSSHSKLSYTVVDDSIICTRFPTESDDDCHERTECILFARTKRHLPIFTNNTSLSPPPPCLPPAYKIEMESGVIRMFAQRELNVGDLILVGRPSMILPLQITEAIESKEFREGVLRVAFSRMSSVRRTSILSVTHDDSNPYLTDMDWSKISGKKDVYWIVFGGLSTVDKRIIFNLPSFSFQLCAKSAIKEGEVISISPTELLHYPAETLKRLG